MKSGMVQNVILVFTQAEDKTINSVLDELASRGISISSEFANQLRKTSLKDTVRNSFRTNHGPKVSNSLTALSGSGTITLTYPALYIRGHVGDPIWPTHFTIYKTGGTDSNFSQLMNLSTSPVLAHCVEPGIPSPAPGTYSMTWNAVDNGDGTYTVYYVIHSDVPCSTLGGVWSRWGGHTQRFEGSFKTSKLVHNVAFTFKKTCADTLTLQQYPNDYSLAGAVYDVYTSIDRTGYLGSITTNRDGNASATFKNLSYTVGTLYCYERTAPKNYQLNPNVVAVTVSGDKASGSQSESTSHGNMCIRKVDQHGNPVANAQLTIYSNNGNAFKTVTTGADGAASISDVPAGKYTVKETGVPNGYYPSSTASLELKPSDIESNKTISVEMTDPEIIYLIRKYDREDASKTVPGCTMELFRQSDNVPIEQWVTDANNEWHKLGTGTMMNGWDGRLVYGQSYYVLETGVPDGYDLSNSEQDKVSFTINSTAGQKEYTLNGVKEKGIGLEYGNRKLKYEVQKLDKLTGKALSGITLQLKDKNGKVLDEWKTDGKPHQIEYKRLHYGNTYYIHEAKTIPGYYYMERDVEFTADNTGGVWHDINCYDFQIRYNVRKVNKENRGLVANAEMALYDSNGKKLYTWTTANNKGQDIPIQYLEAGKSYLIKELNAPDGYYLNADPLQIKVAETSATEVEKGIVYEEMTDAPILVQAGKYGKTSKDEPAKMVAGATLAIYEKNSSGKLVQVGSNFTSVEGYTTLPNTYFKSGHTYYLKEVASPAGYYYFLPEGSDGNLVEFKIPDTQQDMEKNPDTKLAVKVSGIDYPIKYQVLKVDGDGNPVEGVHLALYDGSTELEEWISSKKPYVITRSLTAGHHYIIKELSGKAGYFKADEISFDVPEYPTSKEDINKVKSLQFVTEHVVNERIDVKLKKTDENGNLFTTNSSGQYAAFEIYNANGTKNNLDDDVLVYKADELRTDASDYQAKGYFDIGGRLSVGTTYRIHEAVVPDGYSVAADQFITISSKKQNHAVFTMKDASLHVRVTKVDADGKVLKSYTDQEGNTQPFTFDVYNTLDNSKVLSFDTSDSEYASKGYIDIGSKMKFGVTYKIVESSYPVGYYKSQDGYFTLANDDIGKVKLVTMKDPPIKVKFRKEDTSFNSLMDKSFKFQVVDKATGKSVHEIDTAADKQDAKGFIHFGSSLQEGHTYQIVETDWPVGYSKASPVEFTVPTYYQAS